PGRGAVAGHAPGDVGHAGLPEHSLERDLDSPLRLEPDSRARAARGVEGPGERVRPGEVRRVAQLLVPFREQILVWADPAGEQLVRHGLQGFVRPPERAQVFRGIDEAPRGVALRVAL